MRTYELRTRANAPVYRFDDLARAQTAKAESEARIKTPLKLFEITVTEREIVL